MAKTPSTSTLQRKLKKLAPDYRAYCHAQARKAQAASGRAVKAAQREMDALRPSYTEYRRTYNALRKLAA